MRHKISLSNTQNRVLIAGLIFLCLVPFSDKAFHIDDPLFIWTAKNILSHPFDFYGFSLNWENYVRPMSDIQQNPPLVSYFIASVGFLFGFTEHALHLSFILISVICAFGVQSLSIKLNANQTVALFSCILTPIYLISSTNIMSDLLMVTFWVWAINLWVLGIRTQKNSALFGSAALITLASLTKYFGISLVPLLALYSLYTMKRISRSLNFLLIPLTVAILYQLITQQMYGSGLLENAIDYATSLRVGGGPVTKVITTTLFCGGGIISSLFLLPCLWQRKHLLALTMLSFILFSGSVLYLHQSGELEVQFSKNVSYLVQVLFYTISGVHIFQLCIDDWLRNKDSDSLLLITWVAGTFIFTCFINWTVSARNILPLVPAVAILIARRYNYFSLEEKACKKGIVFPIVLCLVFSTAVNYADYVFANSARKAAESISEEYGNSYKKLFFQGHWGFQYYMEKHGGRALDKKNPEIASGDILITPSNNSYVSSVPLQNFNYQGSKDFNVFPWVSTLNSQTGAGFYSDVWGHLPFVFASAPDERYFIHQLK